MSWKWALKGPGPNYIEGVCPRGHVVRREGLPWRIVWWFSFGMGDCPDCEALE